MLTGLHTATPERLQLGAGVFLRNFSLDGAESAAQLKKRIAAAIVSDSGVMGATRGGGTFTCTPMLRSIEADGVRTPFVGGTVNDGWQVRLTGTLLEVTPDNVASLLLCADVTRSGNVTTVEAREDIAEGDYIPHLCWVGDTARGLVAIELTGVLNRRGAVFTFRDKGEGELPFEFQAHAEDLQQEKAPFRVVFFQ